jgi:hypothetical protein
MTLGHATIPLRIVLAIASCVPGARAAMFNANLSTSDFGNLNQHNTNCPDLGCGATAAINSFVFLQNMYPDIYVLNLVPLSTPLFPSQADESAAANALSGPAYMNTTCSCGTPWPNFIEGKGLYLEDPAHHVAGLTRYAAQSGFIWDTTKLGAKPPFLQDNTAPTPEFVAQELNDKEDVEILINFPDSAFQGHYVTLTGFTYDDILQQGSITYIDPEDGKAHSTGIFGAGASPGLFLSYTDPSTGMEHTGGEITVAVSESPTPEPASVFLVLAGLFGVLWKTRMFGRRRCRLHQHAPRASREVLHGSTK